MFFNISLISLFPLVKKDHTFYVAILCLFFLFGLISLRWLPPIKICGYKVKTVDMFSDIEKEKKPLSTTAIPKVKPKVEISCPKGQTCIEDYKENISALSNFFKSLQDIKVGKKVRIAFFGDSFIEGDVMCGDFRDLLQEKFGGEGVGIVPMTSAVSQFRQTIKEDYKGFKSYDLVHNAKEKLPYPPFGYCSIPGENNYANFYSTKFSLRTQKFSEIRILYQSNKEINVNINANNFTQNILLPQAYNIQTQKIELGSTEKVKLSFSPNAGTYLYGISFEGGQGIYVDNFSLRGNSGTALLTSKKEMHQALNQIQDYSLVILQYGINAMNAETTNWDWYIRIMNKVIQEIKELYPQSDILLLGIPDRSHKVNGEYKTMTTVTKMIEVQRTIAAENKIAFWNVYQAMGGENSMVEFVKAKPSKANLDYTHLNFLGGKEVANLLYKSLIFDYEKHKTQ
ncbi:hypothetical protein C4S77_02325 [Apibacter adventoris]|uniref:SGNH hydrolase-type esterase domain-containing protein n=1 Tax=Apibacter adventoris TaxID=1679466 RepID=A0A2S8AFU9_9FLAO|nr:hypothetical protein C4S77_02325 [Apibacter adventoris]